jgi:hypothetical protein
VRRRPWSGTRTRVWGSLQHLSALRAHHGAPARRMSALVVHGVWVDGRARALRGSGDRVGPNHQPRVGVRFGRVRNPGWNRVFCTGTERDVCRDQGVSPRLHGSARDCDLRSRSRPECVSPSQVVRHRAAIPRCTDVGWTCVNRKFGAVAPKAVKRCLEMRYPLGRVD